MRSKPFGLRLDDDTRARWQAAADDAGYSLSEFIKAAVELHLASANVQVTITHSTIPGVEVVQPQHVIAAPSDKPRLTLVPGGKTFKGPDPKPEASSKSRRKR